MGPIRMLEGQRRAGFGQATRGTAPANIDVFGESVEVFQVLASVGTRSDNDVYHRTISAIHGLSASIGAAEAAGWPRERILEAISPARAIQGSSPFVKRLQDWPRGYPGDFETIEHLCEGRNHAPRDTIGFQVERYCLNSSIAQQHRNKVQWQAEKILTKALRHGNPRILSIGCGGSRDLLAIRDLIDGRQIEVVLNDLDPAALAFSMARLGMREANIRAVAGDVFRSSRAIQCLGPFDLIVAGGLFDYLPAKHARWLLRRAVGWLMPGGSICLTNIATGNPERYWMEYIANWTLLERSEEDIRELVSDLDFIGEVQVKKDTTGLTHLVELRCQTN